jgi:ABC-2 type transport system ATP-binding protein
MTAPSAVPGVAHYAPTQPMIETHGLTKRFGARTAVDNLDMEVPAGSLAGFLGPNGAGKTTTLRMLLGLVRPNAGHGRVLGVPLTEPAGCLARIGAMIESPAFYPALSAERNLAVLATLGGADLATIPAVLERVGLGGRGADAYKTYSLGMKQRLGIAAALLRQPALLILDEPSNGLDPAGIRQMRDLLRSFTGDGLTVFVSSHLLSEVEQVCDWLVVIDRGRRVFQGPTKDLLATGPDTLVLGCEHATDLPRLEALVRRLGPPATRDGDRLSVDLSAAAVDGGEGPARVVAEMTRAAASENITLVEVTLTRAHLEERYLGLLSGDTR